MDSPQSEFGTAGHSPAGSSFYWGSVKFGENIEDEWFITWLLLELTREFPVAARVWDNDGDFLLIEAAYSLPRWLKPEVAFNRVWLHSGSVHLIPLPKSPGQLAEWGKETLTGPHALCALLDATEIMEAAGKGINDALKSRLRGYPGKAKEMMHRSVAVVPARIAHVLRKDPQSVASAVEAFHYRDPYDIRAARAMAYFPPHDLVKINVGFNRCLYAQIALQEYAAPKAWPPLPPPSHADYPAALLGVKIAAGYEILLTKDAQHVEESSRAVLELLNEPIDVASFQKEEVLSSDSDTWLREGPSILEEELRKREAEVEAEEKLRQQHRKGGADDAPPSPSFDPGELSSKMKAFMDASAGLDGAEIPQNIDQTHRTGGDVTDFNEMQFFAELERVLGIAAARHTEPSQNQNHHRRGENHSDDDDDSSSEEGSSFYSDRSSESESDVEVSETLGEEEERRQAPAPVRPWTQKQPPEGEKAAERGFSTTQGMKVPAYGVENSTSEHVNLNYGNVGWETATDSDDDQDFDFMESYDAALAQQLAGTSLAHTFTTAEDLASHKETEKSEKRTANGMETSNQDAEIPYSSTSGGKREPMVAGEPTYSEEEEEEEEKEEGIEIGETEGAMASLQPLDIDANLVSSLLASYKEQGGLPGPASTLAGLLGIRLPDSE